MLLTSLLSFFAGSALIVEAAPLSPNFQGSDASSGYSQTPISWGPCPGSETVPHLDCGNISVPIDWSKPHGARITLVLARLCSNQSSTGTCQGRSNLHINPGGPGGVASTIIIDTAKYADVSLARGELQQAYNLIGLDPRGVGLSTPLYCDGALRDENISYEAAASNETEFARLTAMQKALSESCARLSGEAHGVDGNELLSHVDTRTVVYDFDAVRRALGDEDFNLLGFSYGTQIGAQYAEEFPDRIGRMVLDGISDHSLQGVMMMLSEATAYEASLGQFFDWCREHGNECPISKDKNSTVTDPATVFEGIVEAVTKNPIPTLRCNLSSSSNSSTLSSFSSFLLSRVSAPPHELTSRLLHTGLIYTLKSNHSYGVISSELARLANIIASPRPEYCLDVVDIEHGRSDDAEPYYRSYAVKAVDWPGLRSATDMSELLSVATTLAPHTQGVGFSLDVQMLRPGWVFPVTNPPHELNTTRIATAKNKVLLVNSLYDPVTSIASAQNVRRQFPEGTPLIVRNGGGHGSYNVMGETRAAIDRFLIHGELPVDGTMYNS